MHLALLAALVIHQPSPRKVAVLDLAAKGGVAADDVETFAELLQGELRDRGLLVVGRKDIEAMLGLEKLRDSLGCDSAACLAEIGGALGVDEILYGMVSRAEGRLVVSLKRVDPKQASVLRQVARKLEGGLIDNAGPIARELFDPPKGGDDFFAGHWRCEGQYTAQEGRPAAPFTASLIIQGGSTSYDETSGRVRSKGQVTFDAASKKFTMINTINGTPHVWSSTGWNGNRWEWIGTVSGTKGNLPFRQTLLRRGDRQMDVESAVLVGINWHTNATATCSK